ncbi:hypothetical protein BV25DRAFT_1809175 [Artomyces pyxidatus]|uniref:Uncharacterized protein n=1 Tax=Artomyces pyxidatus TaxID=48021 RepID=A0ACB8SS70_9AGAM|nr:hypothetical protein BV25DRAFT_1809175 [Artomyces pyxidatus]
MSTGGAPPRPVLKKLLLQKSPRPTASFTSRRGRRRNSANLHAQILAAERAQAKWTNDHFVGAVYSAQCTHLGRAVEGTSLVAPCTPCRMVSRVKTFRNALRRRAPSLKNAKYTPKSYRNELVGKAYARHTDVQELMEMDAGQSRWLIFAKRGASGRYKNQEAFLGMMDAIMKVEDRRFRGKGLQNIQYDASYDTVCTTLALICPRGYRILQAEFAGRTLRNISLIQQKIGRFQSGIVAVNFDAALQWAFELGYSGPFILAVDDTKVLTALRSYVDGTKWKLGGMHGTVKTFKTYDDLVKKADVGRNDLAEKTRAWLLLIPFPGIPPRLIATMPLRSRVARPELRKWHDEIERQLEAREMHHITYNVDGASTERGLAHDFEDEAVDEGRVHTWSYLHPERRQPPLILSAPLLSNGKPRIPSTDGKHCKKNARGSATSGARTLALGRYLVHYGQLAELAEGDKTPLLKADIIGVDKQDDRAAARLFSSAVIDYLSCTQPDELGLIIYLFVIGEIVDAQQNRSISHTARIKMLWRGHFFLQGWRYYILRHPQYSVNTHFITRELYDILCVYINAMLLLILVHRDFFPDTPLLHWLSSTEVCEHFFGCARKIQKDFTYVEWLLMIPKLSLLMAGESKLKGIQAAARDHRSGYNHSWFDARGIDLKTLATFPNDATIQTLVDSAYEEAQSLLRLLGIEPTPLPDTDAAIREALAEPLSHIRRDQDPFPGLEEEDTNPVPDGSSGAAALDQLLLTDDLDERADTRSGDLDDKMTNLGIATAAVVVHDTLMMYVLFVIVLETACLYIQSC